MKIKKDFNENDKVVFAFCPFDVIVRWYIVGQYYYDNPDCAVWGPLFGSRTIFSCKYKSLKYNELLNTLSDALLDYRCQFIILKEDEYRKVCPKGKDEIYEYEEIRRWD